jgi:hypothetical protein
MMLHDVVEVQLLGGYRLHIRFDDGVSGSIDVSDMVDFHGVFAPLKDPLYFAQVRVNPDLGTIVWPNGADLDPVVLYSRVTGKPIPDFTPALLASRD